MEAVRAALPVSDAVFAEELDDAPRLSAEEAILAARRGGDVRPEFRAAHQRELGPKEKPC